MPLVARYAGAPSEGEVVKLFVGMLARSTQSQEVEELFSRFGAVKEVFIMTV